MISKKVCNGCLMGTVIYIYIVRNIHDLNHRITECPTAGQKKYRFTELSAEKNKITTE